MPTLNWIGKDAVINHYKEVPFHLFKPIDKLSVVPKTSEVSGGHVIIIFVPVLHNAITYLTFHARLWSFEVIASILQGQKEAFYDERYDRSG